jgi:hypothetical protein
MAWLKRALLSLAFDAQVVLALAYPAACTYLRWVMLGVYAVLSVAVWRQLRRNRWFFSIIGDRQTRITHGLEHATIALLVKQNLPIVEGHTHGPDRFRVFMDGGHAGLRGDVRCAAEAAIQRIIGGERSLAYHPGCGTSDIVAAVTLWSVYASALVACFAVGGRYELFFALSVIVFRVWLAFETPLGLMAQRLWTVSTNFTTATVVEVLARTEHVADGEQRTAFEIVVDIRIAASTGGLVAPGALPG